MTDNIKTRSAQTLAASMPGADEKQRDYRLLTSLFVNFFVLLALYNGVLNVLLPNQIEAISPENKASNLALVYAVTSVFSTLTTPIAGALSDRTKTKWGKRSPWIAFGALIGSIALFGVSFMTTIVSITVLWVIAAVAYNCAQPSLTAVIADRFPEKQRGIASGFVGAGTTAGGTVGIILAGRLANDHMVLGYFIFAAAIAATCVAFVLLNREAESNNLTVAPFNLKKFAKGFWISPKENPDFAWAFGGRFTIYMGYQALATFMLYILQDYINLSTERSNIVIGNISAISFVTLVITTLVTGYWSDKIQRRKPFVFASTLIMATAMVVPLFMPTVAGMYIFAAIIGVGYGTFMAVDLALITQVLPKSMGDDDTGKDLGILTTAINVPQIFSPVMAAWLLNTFNQDYTVLFMVAIAFTFVGSFFVLPIKSVR